MAIGVGESASIHEDNDDLTAIRKFHSELGAMLKLLRKLWRKLKLGGICNFWNDTA